jgi:hypothetical protein
VNIMINSNFGELKSPALRVSGEGMRNAVDQAKNLKGNLSTKATQISPLASIAMAANEIRASSGNITSCRQKLWFTLFFDGTGNNLYADQSFSKHSNVAKLFLIHKKDDKIKGNYSIYIPGVGTYFAAVNDSGGNPLGLGCGAMGEARLNYGLAMFDKNIERHLKIACAPSASIDEINLAVFGFSRGAALARAFINLFLEKRCLKENGKFILRSGRWPVRIRFMGLFDTVASVGLPLSFNTINTPAASVSSPRSMMFMRLQVYANTAPNVLAFGDLGRAGADPVPGSAHGHDDWGGRLEIDGKVEEVRHFIAGHEMRNSFPVDSISVFTSGKIKKPEKFYETVYPGVHSDVGGSYAPEEGGKNKGITAKLGVIPLLHMYEHALSCGVPFIPVNLWPASSKTDFEIDPAVTKIYDHYLSKLKFSSSLGEIINGHMQLYFQWRFRVIRQKLLGDQTENIKVEESRKKFAAMASPLDQELSRLKSIETAAGARVDLLRQQVMAHKQHAFSAQDSEKSLALLSSDLAEAAANHLDACDNVLSMQAKRSALPDMKGFQNLRDIYDNQMMKDVRAITQVLADKSGKGRSRADLRPHYKNLLNAYEEEFIHNRGLSDQKVIQLFEEFIHDSLAGFGKDATLPSDPRVVYLGGDQKLGYANRDRDETGMFQV